MRGFVEDRKQRVRLVAEKISKGLKDDGEIDYELLLAHIQFDTGVTDKKAREYVQLIIKQYGLSTRVEDNKAGRKYWIEAAK